eukprot:CAMPEP_0168743752 /NCGR_PEP_ID=MMETSP0724-20121128/13740_1 /TAXON_ID=265536 /ORGANISM="Amphiprora sp., Strain CCMP467" /LENGTH=252 /DNA_ID=CAMNT_0008791395 /DNA_START=55 /DNA_END=813 /DNA_ORIENTATION=+
MKPGVYKPPSDSLIVEKQPTPSSISWRDDVSLSSTLTADAPPAKSLSSLPPPSTIVERDIQKQFVEPAQIVRFDEDNIVYYENEDMTADDCKEFWYNITDYGNFKKEIVKSAKAILRAEAEEEGNTMGMALEAAYASCFECQDEEPRTLSFIPREIQSFMKNHYRSKEQEEETILGLERLVVRRISKDRQELRKCLFDIVFDLQKGFRADKQVLADNIATVSEEATRAGRLFATALGAAHVPYLLTRRPSYK